MIEEIYLKRLIPLIQLEYAVCPEVILTETINEMRKHFQPLTEYNTFARVFENFYLEIELRA